MAVESNTFRFSISTKRVRNDKSIIKQNKPMSVKRTNCLCSFVTT